MAGEKSVRLMLLGDNTDAKLKIDAIDVKADELAAKHPELKIGIDSAAAQEKLAILRSEMKAAGDDAVAMNEKAKVSTGLFGMSAATGAKAWEAAKIGMVGLGGAIGLGIYKAAGFQAVMERLHTQAGVTTPMMHTLSAGVLQLAGQVGYNPDSLAEALYHVSSNFAGLHATAPQMLDALKVAAEGARVGGSNLVDTTNALGAVIAANLPGVHSYSEAMGMLNKTVGEGDMTMQDLADAMGTGFLANVKLYGTTLQDTSAILATFGDNLVRGEHAGTQLRMSVQSIAVQAKTAGPYLKELGLHAGELGKTQALHGTVAAIQLFVDHLKSSKVPMDEWGNYVTQIFGKKAGGGIGILVDQLDSRLLPKFKAAAAGASDFGNAWAATQNTTSQQFANLKNGAEALVTQLGLGLLPAALSVTKALNEFLGAVMHNSAGAATLASVIGVVLAGLAFKKLEDGVTGAIGGFESLWHGYTKIIGGAVQLGAKILGLAGAQEAATVATEGETAAQEGLNVAMDANVIGLIVLAIAGLVIGFKELWDHSAAFRDFWKGLWHDINVMVDDAVSFIKTHWEMIPTILGGPIVWATAFIASHWNQITSGAEHMVGSVVGFFERLPGMILHALGDLGHLLWDAGGQIIQGLVNGVMSNIGAVGSIASSIGSTLLGGVKSVLGIHSPSREFYLLGEYITQGLGNGIHDSAHQAIEESRKLGADIRAAANEGLITYSEANSLESRLSAALDRQLSAAAKRNSQSAKVMRDLGLIMHENLLAGLEGTAGSVRSAVSKLVGVVKTEMDNGWISYGKATGITDWLERDSNRLQSLATQRANILKTIATAEKYATTVTNNTISSSDVVSAASAAGQGSGAAGIEAQLNLDVAQIRQFAANIAQLRKMGLNKAYLDQIIQAGPVNGGAIAAELVQAGTGDIRLINSDESQIQRQSVVLGQAAANAMYDSGKNAGKGFLSGLEGQQKALEDLMTKIAKSMVGTLKRELGIRSPSTVMREHGQYVGQGLALGIEDSIPRVTEAMHGLVRNVAPSGLLDQLSRATDVSAYSRVPASASNQPLQVEWIGSSAADQQFITWLKKNIRFRGGDPSVLGR